MPLSVERAVLVSVTWIRWNKPSNVQGPAQIATQSWLVPACVACKQAAQRLPHCQLGASTTPLHSGPRRAVLQGWIEVSGHALLPSHVAGGLLWPWWPFADYPSRSGCCA